MFNVFRGYKRNISTFGVILLSSDCSSLALCRTWEGNKWTFPQGKVNENESGVDAAIRETYEETGFDVRGKLGGIVGFYDNSPLPWGGNLSVDDEISFDDAGKQRTLYVCHGAPMDFPFEPVARKEVSEVAFHGIADLGRKSVKTFAVLSFFPGLKRWIKANHPKCFKKLKKELAASEQQRPASNKRSNKRDSSNKKERQGDSADIDSNDNSLGNGGWTAEEMFQANEKLGGKKTTYTGNPHEFGESGPVKDPHKFHIVGGGYMNSGSDTITGTVNISEGGSVNPKATTHTGSDADLQPFFAENGESIFEQQHKKGPKKDKTEKSMSGVKILKNDSVHTSTNVEGANLLKMLRNSKENSISTKIDDRTVFDFQAIKKEEKEMIAKIVRSGLNDAKETVARVAADLGVNVSDRSSFIEEAMLKVDRAMQLKQ